MPKVEPIGGDVNWSKDEGVLGVVGVAPWATIEFCKAFYGKIKASKDWHYPRVILDINTKLPSRGRYFQLSETDPSPYISETIAELYNQGATVAVVPCNTAHILYDRWSVDAPIPVINIVRETLNSVANANVKSIVSFTSSDLANYNLFGQQAEEMGIKSIKLEESTQSLVSNIIEDIKKNGVISENNRQSLDLVIRSLKMQGIGAAILGCTELSLLSKYFDKYEIQSFDSNEALAEAAVKALNISLI
jgi:aspartate racemase